MRFGNPQMLWVLLAVPVLVGLLIWSQARRRQALSRFAVPVALSRLGVVLPGWRSWIRPALALLAVTGIVIATARPQWGWEDRRIVSRGVDLMIAIDTSTSMLAQDYKPSRLDRAKELLQNIIWEAKGDRIGVIAFAGNAVVLCPLTLDYSMANAALESVDTRTIQTQGTAIGVAIDSATKAFETGGAGERVLVLLTDGEDQGTQPLEAAKRAQAAKIKIFCIGIGSTQGTLIPVSGGYKQDSEGHPVNSKLDFQTLTEIAKSTNGQALKANFSGAAEVRSILGELSKLKGANQQDRVYRVYTERYPWFLVPAILLLLLEAFGVGAPRRRQSAIAPAQRRAAAAALLLSLLLPASRTFAYPGESKVLSDKALQEYKQGEYAKAAQDFAEAAVKAGDNALTKFNLGAARYKAGESSKAQEAFKSVFDPENPAVNAAAEYNVGVLEHKEARKELEAKKQDWEQAAGKGDDKVMEDMKKSIAKLETATSRYKSAILKTPDDRDMKTNYEIARRDLDEMKKLLEKQQPPPQQQQQQQQQQKQDQQQKQQPQQGNRNDQQQQGNKGDQQKQDQQQKSDQDKKNQSEQQQAKNDQQKKDQEKNKSDQSQKDQQQKDQEQAEQNEKQSKPETAKATPTPQPDKQQGSAASGSAGDESDKQEQEEVAIGEMSKSDVDRLLNSMPPENTKALQKFLNSNYKMRENMDKDW